MRSSGVIPSRGGHDLCAYSRNPMDMSLFLLGSYAQAMLTALSGEPFSEDDIRHLVRIVVEGIGEQARSPTI
jgi:hypothetical protein